MIWSQPLKSAQRFRQQCLGGGMVARISLVLSAIITASPMILAETPETERLIQQLGSSLFNEREAAAKKLEALGEQVLKPLEKAVATAPDPEVRNRSQRLITTIRAQLARSGDSRRLGGHGDTLSIAEFSADAGLLLTGGYDKVAHIWEVKSGKVLTSLTGHRGPVR